MRVVTLALIIFATTARAAIYENAVSAEDEDDLFAAEQRGDISEGTRDTLLELIREGVDLNSASRDELYDLPGITYADVDAIIEYRKVKARIEDPSELVGAGAITAEQLLQIAPFIRIDAAAPKLPIGANLRALARATSADNVPPPGLLVARLRGPFDLSAGFMLTSTRRLVATPTYNPENDALQTTGFGYHLHLPRAFLQWKSGKRRLVAGTFTIGFGERLTIDNTRRVTPNGIYLTDDFRRPIDLTRTCKLSGGDVLSGGCAADEKNVYITPDLDWREVFRGVAGSIEDISLGDERSVSMYGFLSYQSRSLYQYELYDRRTCDDPSDDDSVANINCKAPEVAIPSRGTLLIYGTLPYIFDELTGGGHVDFKPSYRFTVGVTGYGSMPFFKASPAQLDFQEWSTRRNGGAFGAVGVNAKAAWNGLNFFLEATRTFDRAVNNEGGGLGVEQRTTWSPKGHELDLSLRYYDLHFANPYGRPVSSPGEYDGLSARNELGARLRYVGKPNRDWELRARVDFWVNPYAVPAYTPPGDEPRIASPAGITNLYGLMRADFVGWDVFQPGVWVDVRNRNLGSNVRGRCASGTVLLTQGSPYNCNGDFYRVAARFEIVAHKRYARVVTQAWLTFTDDVKYKDVVDPLTMEVITPGRFRTALMVSGEVRSQPFDWLQLRLKTRYQDQDTSTLTYLEDNVWTYLEAAWLPAKGTRLALRYDLFVWLDQRESTLSRIPNPEHRFMLDLRTSF